MQSFVERFVNGARGRSGVEPVVESTESASTSLAQLAEEAAAGALAARVAWEDGGVPHAGCLLWLGGLDHLLGGGGRAIAELGDEEVASLDAALRLNVEEGGERRPAVRVVRAGARGPDGLDAVLNQSGVGVPEAYGRVVVRWGGAAIRCSNSSHPRPSSPTRRRRFRRRWNR